MLIITLKYNFSVDSHMTGTFYQLAKFHIKQKHRQFDIHKIIGSHFSPQHPAINHPIYQKLKKEKVSSRSPAINLNYVI